MVPPPAAAAPGRPDKTPQPAGTLSANYRITFSGKSNDKPLGELSSLTCSNTIRLSGPLSSSDEPTTFSVSGTLEEKDGLIVFNYAIEFRVPVVSTPQGPQPNQPVPPGGYRSVQYMDHSSTGMLKMKPGKAYDLLKAGGNTYSITVAPELDKEPSRRAD